MVEYIQFFYVDLSKNRMKKGFCICSLPPEVGWLE